MVSLLGLNPNRFSTATHYIPPEGGRRRYFFSDPFLKICHSDSERSEEEESLSRQTLLTITALQFPTKKANPMPKEITWSDAEDIGILLAEKHPDVDPLTVRFTDLHRYVTELADFKDDPQKSNEAKLEAIQMAWHEEYVDAQG